MPKLETQGNFSIFIRNLYEPSIYIFCLFLKLSKIDKKIKYVENGVFLWREMQESIALTTSIVSASAY